MERKTIEENKNGARDYAVLVGLRSPVLWCGQRRRGEFGGIGGLSGDGGR